MIERVPAVVYVDASDEVSSAIYMSPRAEEMLGYSPQEWLADPDLWVRLLHEGDRERVLAEQGRTRRTGEPFAAEYRLLAKDGRVVWVRDEAELVEEAGRPPVWHGILVDVTAQKEAEAALSRSEERFRLVAGVAGEAIWDNDLLTGAQEWDGATEALFGYPPHEGRTGAWWEERIHPDDRCRVLSGLGAVLEGRAETWADEYRFRRTDGSYAHVEDRGRVVRDAEGKPARMVGSMRDVTEKRRHQEEIRRSEELFRTAFESAGVGMAHVTPDGRWLRVNDKLCEISGYDREELLGMTFLELTPPGDRPASIERVRRMLEGKLGPYSLQRRYVRKDGFHVWVNLSVSLARKTTGEPDFFICVAENITERKIAELVPDPVSDQELEVLRLVAFGHTNTQIAKELRYSLGGVKHQIQRIITKLSVENRGQAVTRAVEIGLIPCPESRVPPYPN
jgi:PAS domain S-box-containing protein